MRRLRRVAARWGHRRPVALPVGFPPTVSFTFDDFPASAAEAAAPVLEAAGMRGTWYLAAGLMGRETEVGRIADAATAARLRDAGHEIGCHTFSHLRLGEAGGRRAAADIAANRDALRGLLPEGPSFSYPFGDVGPGGKAAAAAVSSTCRTTEPGIVQGGADLNFLPGTALYSGAPLGRALDLVRRARTEGGWLILYTHDVTGAPSAWGCTPAEFARVVEAAAGLCVRTVGEVAASLNGAG